MSERTVVTAEHLGKRFKIYARPWQRALEWSSGGRVVRHQEFWALRDVSFTLEQGQCIGVIGPNGSGKTTLLKLLSRVLRPSEGRFELVAPHIYSLLELGTGFHPDLTGRENVHQSVRLLGLPVDCLSGGTLDEIREFADLGDYFDRPIRYYSSGMLMRLGFSVFAFLKPDLLVVDEALSVGDVFFQQKCMRRIDALRESGASFVFVSHDMAAVRRLCETTVVLEHGRVVYQGPTGEAINRYHAIVFPRAPGRPAPQLAQREAESAASMSAGPSAAEVRAGSILRPGGRRHGGRAAELQAVRITDEQGRGTLSVPLRDTLLIDLLIVAREPVESPSAGIALTDRLGNLAFSAGTGQLGHRLPALRAGESLVVRLSVRFSLQPGPYAVMLGVSELGHALDWHEDLGPIEVYHGGPDPIPFHGIADLPMECRHGQVEPGATKTP